MERTRKPHRWLSLFAILALVFALAACGSAVVPGEVEDETPIEDVVDDGASGGDETGGPQTPDEVEYTYTEDPTIDGEPITQDDIDEMDDFDGVVLRGDFSGFDFSNKDLAKAILAGAKFENALFVRAKFNGVKLWGGWFVGADFTDAHFAGADLSYGNFREAIFTRAQMPGESFKTVDAYFEFALWVDGDTVCAEGSVGTCN